MTSYSLFLLLLVVVIAPSMASKIHAEELQEASVDVRSLRGVEEERELQRKFDIFSPEDDLCKNGEGQYGVCDQSRFPTCQTGRTLICYNRRPMREFFYADIRQPFYYIDYDNVFCYPDTWGGCSSCSPGRYCLSESRCILDEQNYPCEQWI